MKTVLLSIAVLILTSSFNGQSKSSGSEERISLRDISEVVLVNGRPALKVLSRKKGGYTEVKLQKHDAEDALVFDVVKLSRKNPVGSLFVTKTMVIFESYEKKETNLAMEKAKIEKFDMDKSADGFASLILHYGGDEAKFVVKFDRYRHLIDRAAQREAHALLYRAIEDFDKTLAEFNELTKSAFPERH
jgi:hypothetical protein